MSSSAQLAVLRATIALVGSHGTLAKRLDVSDLQVREWASGEQALPATVYVKVIDVLHEATARTRAGKSPVSCIP